MSSTAAAAICNGFLADLIKGGILSKESAYLALDKCKMQRARKAAMEEATDDNEMKHKEEKIQGISFDSRKDTTFVQK